MVDSTQKAVEELGAAASGGLGAKIRTLFNAIGNSTVTAAVVIGLSLMMCSAMFIASHVDVDLAAARKLNANARYTEILNDKAEGVVAVGIFGAIVPIPTIDGISLKFKAVANATEYRVKWHIDNLQGLETFLAPTVDVDGNVTLVMAKEKFGTSWANDERIICQLFVSDSTGRTISSKVIPVRVVAP